MFIFAAFLWMGNTIRPNYLKSTAMERVILKPMMTVVPFLMGAALLVLPGAPPPEFVLPQSPLSAVYRGNAARMLSYATHSATRGCDVVWRW